MPKPKTNQKEPELGVGTLRLGRLAGRVSYVMTAYKGTRIAYRGSATGDPQLMREAFRRGDGILERGIGPALNIRFMSLTQGSGTAYFEFP